MIYAFGWIVLGTIGVVTLFAVAAGVVGVVIFGLGFLGFIYLGFVPPITGAIRASNGEVYRYPFSIRFVKAPGER
jgi:uncharacterized Tic20 family protein